MRKRSAVRMEDSENSITEITEEVNKNSATESPDHPYSDFEGNLTEETLSRTINCKGFPKDGSVKHEKLSKQFQKYGPYETIYMRQFFDKQTNRRGFTGSILLVFPSLEKAKEFMGIDDVHYNEIRVVRKWHKDFIEEKERKMKERKAIKEAKLTKKQEEQPQQQKQGQQPQQQKQKQQQPPQQQKREQQPQKQQQQKTDEDRAPELCDIEPIPRGSFLFAKGFAKITTREDIKASMMEYTDTVAFVEFSKGDTEGYIRLATPFTNKDILERIDGKLKVNGADITLRIVEGEEEDTQVKKAEEAKSKVFSQSRSNKKRKFGARGGGRPKKMRR